MDSGCPARHHDPVTSNDEDHRAAYRWGRLDATALPAWTGLTNHLAEVDGTEEFYEQDDLAEELEETGFDPTRDSWAVWSPDGQLVAFGQLRVADSLDETGSARASLDGGVHPEHRRRGIGRELIGQMEQRAVELAAQRHPGAPVHWRVSGGIPGADVRGLLEHRGYAIARYFNELARPLPGEPLPEPELPPGVELVTPTDAHEEAVRLAHNEAFRDHWGSTEMGAGRWHDYWTARSNRPGVSVLATDGEQVLAYVLCGQWVPRELYVNLVGTVRPARGQGLASACLARAIRAASAGGEYDVIELGVDSDSPTGATRVYERLGFRQERVIATYRKDAHRAG